MSTTQQPPRRHHYIPEFYLKRWTDSSGRLVEFSKPWNNVVRKKHVYPSETGFVHRLYELKGNNIADPGRIEREYFSPIDSRASKFLLKVEGGGWGFTEMERTAWAQFLLAIVTRHPNHVKFTRDFLHKFIETVSPEEERRWAKRRKKTIFQLFMRRYKDRMFKNTWTARLCASWRCFLKTRSMEIML